MTSQVGLGHTLSLPADTAWPCLISLTIRERPRRLLSLYGGNAWPGATAPCSQDWASGLQAPPAHTLAADGTVACLQQGPEEGRQLGRAPLRQASCVGARSAEQQTCSARETAL